jgi:predicted TIM-barrel fold metal-dependent hydrolase
MTLIDELEIVDAHHHLWDLSTGRYRWLTDHVEPNFLLGDYTAIRRDYLPDDYRIDAHGLKVMATVHIEAEGSRSEALEETRWLHALNAQHGMPNAVVAHTWLHLPEVEANLAAHKRHPLVRGIRCKPVTAPAPVRRWLEGPGTMQDPNFRSGLTALQNADLSWDLRVPYWHLIEAGELCRKFPGLRIVLNHTGLPWDRGVDGLAHWRDGMKNLAESPNVYCKLSELGLKQAPWTVESNRAIVREALDIFGVDRCMFASNFPVASLRIGYRAQVAAMLRILDGLTRDELNRVFRDNALRFYRIG